MENIRLRIDNLELRTATSYDGDSYIEINRWLKEKNDEEYCITIAIFEYDSDGYPELHFVSDRPLELNPDQFKDFIVLVRFGYQYKKINQNCYESI